VLAVVAAAVLAVAARAYFTTTVSTPQTIGAVADFLPPVASRSVVVQAGGIGTIVPGLPYQVYAQVDDQGNPPSGTQTVMADVSSLSGRGVTTTLAAGSYTAGSNTYNFRSPSVNASLLLLPGNKPYTLSMTDALGQSATASFTAGVGYECSASSLTTSNGFLNQTSKVESGDSITYKFTEPIDTTSIIPYWTGGGVGVTVLITDKGSSDELTIIDQSTGQPTPLGVVAMRGDFAHSNVQFGGGIQLQNSTTIVVQINGLYGGTGTPVYWPAKTAMTWTPGAGITDTNGNPCSTTAVTQSPAVYNF
jgi:hypothetical protein